MKKHLLTGLFLLVSLHIFGQINIADSTVQVIGYWDMNETQTYSISSEKYKIKGSDTTSREFSKYKVDITIIDSTANSYTIQWFYRDYVINTDNPILQKLSSLLEEMSVIIKTNELGVLTEVVNWQDFEHLISKTTSILRDEYKDIPQIETIIKQVENMYGTKEAIEMSAIKEIQQFHSFHGAAYKLNEQLEGNTLTPNLLGGDPFDTKFSLSLDEINTVESNYVIRMKQEVDSKQLTDATYKYTSKLVAQLGNDFPDRAEFPSLTNTTWLASRIHNYGWVIYSVETKEVSAANSISFEERIIEIE